MGFFFSVANECFQAMSAWQATFVQNWVTRPKEPLYAGTKATSSQGGGAGLFEMRYLILKVRMEALAWAGVGERGGGRC